MEVHDETSGSFEEETDIWGWGPIIPIPPFHLLPYWTSNGVQTPIILWGRVTQLGSEVRGNSNTVLLRGDKSTN